MMPILRKEVFMLPKLLEKAKGPPPSFSLEDWELVLGGRVSLDTEFA